MPKYLHGFGHHKGSKNEPSKQETRSIRLRKHNSNFNLKLASDNIADFQQPPGPAPSTWQREMT